MKNEKPLKQFLSNISESYKTQQFYKKKEAVLSPTQPHQHQSITLFINLSNYYFYCSII